MRVFFALHSAIDSNSGHHVDGFAGELAARGHEVAVAVPDPTGTAGAGPGYEALTFDDAAVWSFRDGRPPDVVHLWTPRARLERLWRRLERRPGWGTARLVVHLEDNERHLTEAFTGRSWSELAADATFLPSDQLGSAVCVPADAERLLAEADGVTHIIDALRRDIPAGPRSLRLWPGVDLERFRPRPVDHRARRELGVPANCFVLCYPGNSHAANAAEVRSLYVAVALLNRRERPTVLLRAGVDYFPLLGEDPSWAVPWTVDLGPVPHDEIPDLLALADALVQPGRPDEFNDLRFPSKIPEYLAMGRPVVLPRTNIGLLLSDDDAIVLDVADGTAIAGAVAALQDDPALAARLGAGGRAFAEASFAWSDRGAELEDFYRSLSDGPAGG